MLCAPPARAVQVVYVVYALYTYQQGHTTRTIIFAYVVYALCTYPQGRTSCVCNNMHLPGPLNVCIHQPGPSNLRTLYMHYAHTSRAVQVAYALLCTYQDHQTLLNTNQDHQMCVFCVCTMHYAPNSRAASEVCTHQPGPSNLFVYVV